MASTEMASTEIARTAEPLVRPALVCGARDTLFQAIRRCLDGGASLVFVVDDAEHLIGRVTLESLRSAIRAGELGEGLSVGESIAMLPEPANSRDDFSGIATPVLDPYGRLTDILVDHGRGEVPLAKPDLTSAELESLIDAFVSTWISGKGPSIRELELGFAGLVGTLEAIAVSSGTAALHLALLSLGIGPGDEVIVPDLTFAATINAVLHCGATPVIADIDSESWGLSPIALARAITARTKAVIVVHLYGRPAPLETLRCARRYGLAIVEDCAEAQGAEISGARVGSLGDIGCFSLFANKLVSTGEGGMCTTSHEELAARIRELKDHGVNPAQPFWHERVGYNYRMTNLQASIGTVQLKRFDDIVAKRDKVAALYREYLADVPGLDFPPPLEAGSKPVNWLVTVTVPPEKRADLIEAAALERIELRAFFHPLSSMPAYRAYARRCPNAARVGVSGLCLPTSGTEDRHVAEKLARIFHEVLDG